MVAFAGEHQQITSQADTQFTAAHTLALASGQGASLFSHAGPLHAIAANGPVSIQAHTNQMELLSDQSMTVTATDEGIDILAKDHIILTAGKTQITLKGGDITLACPGKFTVKASQHPFSAGESKKAELDTLPKRTAGEVLNILELNFHYSDLEAVRGAPYKVTFDDGTVKTGKLDKQGYAKIEGVPNIEYLVEYGEDEREWKAPKLKKWDAYKNKQSEAEAIMAKEKEKHQTAGTKPKVDIS
jgi:type VI secretion system secreted protein VgrG